MGRELSCRMRQGKKLSQVKVQLESSYMLVQGDIKMKIAFKAISEVLAHAGWLQICSKTPEAPFELELGKDAEKWADKIKNPPSRLDKLGVKTSKRIIIHSLDDDNLVTEIESCGAILCKLKEGNADFVFIGAETKAELASLKVAKQAIQQNGAIWIVYPKGIKAITQADVFEAVKAVDLTDIKVVSFSEELTAIKAVIPTAKRVSK